MGIRGWECGNAVFDPQLIESEDAKPGMCSANHWMCDGAHDWGGVDWNKGRLYLGTVKLQDDQLRLFSLGVSTLNILN